MFQVEEASIIQIQQEMEARKLTSVELVQFYMERIAKYDKSGATLNAILELNPDAFHQAEALDHERKTKGSRGLMHGIPVLLKDNINTGDKMHTSGGSLALADSYAPEDAFVVERLRAAGAVLLGKTNMTEFANFMAENMPSGYSSRGGQVVNPYEPANSPSGSSSGSAVAVTANFCPVAVGTETNGSILSPSRVNQIVGMKPTVGLVSRSGIIPISHSQDTAGPMARTVSDAAILLAAMLGSDGEDPATCRGACIYAEEILKSIASTDIVGLRVGVSTVYYEEFTSDEKQILDEVVQILEQRGAVVIRQNEITKGLPDEGSSVLLHEFKPGINYYLSKLKHPTIRILSDILEFNRRKPEQTLKYGQKILELSEETSGTLSEPRYLSDRLRDIKHTRTEGIDKVMVKYELDALLFLESTSLAAISGYPSIIVPAGIHSGTPYGITFIGKPFQEPRIIRLAYAYEQASGWRVPPRL